MSRDKKPAKNLPDRETLQYMREILLSKTWRFAKTMPKTPHWYTLRKTWGNDILFDEIVLLIRKHGYQHRYGKTWYVKIDIDDMQYWTMGSPVAKTILINRAALL